MLKSFLALAVGMLLQTCVAAFGDDHPGKSLELLDESQGPVPALPCTMAGCATVIAIRHHLGVEPVKSEAKPEPAKAEAPLELPVDELVGEDRRRPTR